MLRRIRTAVTSRTEWFIVIYFLPAGLQVCTLPSFVASSPWCDITDSCQNLLPCLNFICTPNNKSNWQFAGWTMSIHRNVQSMYAHIITLPT